MLIDIHEVTQEGNTVTLKRAFTILWKGRRLRIPKNFESDGASVPRLLWRIVSPCIHPSTIRAAIAHDFLYRRTPAGWSRKEADLFFHDICQRDGLADFPALLAYAGLRLFGWFAWRKNKKEKQDMRKKLAFGMAAAVCLLTGCGHNAVQYGDGVGFDAGINPENCTFSFNLRYGKILSAVTRDNVEIELAGKANAEGSAGTEKTAASSVGTDGSLKVKIGRQINGAAVDLVKAGASADKVLETLNEDTVPAVPAE